MTAVATTIQGLGLTFEGNPVPVVIKKIAKAEDNLDDLPVIMVTPAQEPKGWKFSSFEGQQREVYPILIAIIGSGNMDFYSNIDTYSQWYEAVETAFTTNDLAGVSQVYDCDVKPADYFTRRILSCNYDMLSLTLRFKTIR